MKISIVGSSHLSEGESITARQFASAVLNNYIRDFGKDNLIFISGGAKGVDTEAEDVANQLGIKCEIHKPLVNDWEKGYKPRNLKIAQNCDVIYCFPTKIKTTPCYHCDTNDHEVTGGCWTLKQAKLLKKQVHLVPLI